MTQRGLCPVAGPAQGPLDRAASGLAAKRDPPAGAVARPGHGRRRIQRPHRSRRRVDQPSAPFRELVLFRVFAADCQRKDGHHLGGDPHDPGLRPLERGLQPDARSEMRPLRPEKPLAGFVAAGPAGPRRRANCWAWPTPKNPLPPPSSRTWRFPCWRRPPGIVRRPVAGPRGAADAAFGPGKGGLGWTHANVAGLMARRWSLPGQFAELIEWHVAVQHWPPSRQGAGRAGGGSFRVVAGRQRPGLERMCGLRSLLRKGGAVGESLAGGDAVGQIDAEFARFAPVLRVTVPAKSLLDRYHEAAVPVA